jgi:peroxiredoxin
VGYASGVGREAPAFVITAVDGNEISLEQYRGDWFPILVFLPTRSNDTAVHLARLSAAADQFWGFRGQLVGLCHGTRDEVTALSASATEVAFPLLPDDGTIAAAYGALWADNEPRTMAFIVDRAGKIVWTGEGDESLIPSTLLDAFREVAR